jgi:UDP-2-acetamido-2-deoxy-ribo-hexuluronate aminotransferase
MEFIDLKAQYRNLKPEIDSAIQRVLDHGQYILGPEVKALEDRLATYTKSRHCITVASGTDALLISLMALGIKAGDEVITTPFTFAATAEMITLLGAKPVYIDIEQETGNINASLIESMITNKTKAIIPVSIFGQPPDMAEINDIAAKNGGIPVIEDAAQSFGAQYRNKHSCNLSDIGCTSFFPSKPLGCYGDGGAIFTNNDDLAQAMKEIRVHGQAERYVHKRVGVGGRMDTLQCAIVLAKLQRFDWEIKQRIKLGVRYNDLLDEYKINRIHQKNDRTSVFAQYTILTKNRDGLRQSLNRAGVPTAIHYPIPLNEQPAYRCQTDKNTPVASHLAKQVLSIPIFPDLDEQTQNYIASQIKQATSA